MADNIRPIQGQPNPHPTLNPAENPHLWGLPSGSCHEDGTIDPPYVLIDSTKQFYLLGMNYAYRYPPSQTIELIERGGTLAANEAPLATNVIRTAPTVSRLSRLLSVIKFCGSRTLVLGSLLFEDGQPEPPPPDPKKKEELQTDFQVADIPLTEWEVAQDKLKHQYTVQWIIHFAKERAKLLGVDARLLTELAVESYFAETGLTWADITNFEDLWLESEEGKISPQGSLASLDVVEPDAIITGEEIEVAPDEVPVTRSLRRRAQEAVTVAIALWLRSFLFQPRQTRVGLDGHGTAIADLEVCRLYLRSLTPDSTLSLHSRQLAAKEGVTSETRLKLTPRAAVILTGFFEYGPTQEFADVLGANYGHGAVVIDGGPSYQLQDHGLYTTFGGTPDGWISTYWQDQVAIYYEKLIAAYKNPRSGLQQAEKIDIIGYSEGGLVDLGLLSLLRTAIQQGRKVSWPKEIVAEYRGLESLSQADRLIGLSILRKARFIGYNSPYGGLGGLEDAAVILAANRVAFDTAEEYRAPHLRTYYERVHTTPRDLFALIHTQTRWNAPLARRRFWHWREGGAYRTIHLSFRAGTQVVGGTNDGLIPNENIFNHPRYRLLNGNYDHLESLEEVGAARQIVNLLGSWQ